MRVEGTGGSEGAAAAGGAGVGGAAGAAISSLDIANNKCQYKHINMVMKSVGILTGIGEGICSKKNPVHEQIAISILQKTYK